MMDKAQDMFVPDTVGELIDLLQKYPRDYKLDVCYVDKGDYGSDWEATAYRMKVNVLEDYRGLGLTFS